MFMEKIIISAVIALNGHVFDLNISIGRLQLTLFSSSAIICWGPFVETSRVDAVVFEVQQLKGKKPLHSEMNLYCYGIINFSVKSKQIFTLGAKVYIETCIFKCLFSFSPASGPSCCSRLQTVCQEPQQQRSQPTQIIWVCPDIWVF